MQSFLRLAVLAFAITGFSSLPLTSVSAQKAKQPDTKTSKSTKTAKDSKPKSPCQGLAKTACDSKKAQCSWISPKKKVDKRGRKLTAYCRKTGGTAKSKKTDSKKTADATKPAKTTTAKSAQKKK